MIWTIENGLTRSGPALVELVDALLERLEAADARRDGGADAVRDRRDLEPRVGLGLAGGGEREMREPVHAARRLVVDVVGHLEALHLAGEVHRIAGGVELRDRARAGAARDQPLPGLLEGVPERGHRTDAGDDDPASAVVAAHGHPGYIPRPPSTSRTSPVTNEASSEQRKRTAPATSAGSPSRPSGVCVEHRLRRLFRQDVGQLGLHVARRDDVRAHVAAAELLRERLREPDDPRLRRGVVRLAPVAVDADDRGDVDDRSGALLHHRPRHRPAGVEDRREVGVDHGAPVVVAHPGEQAVAGQARVVDEDVEVARGLDERERRRGIGDVGLHGAAADLLRDLLGLVLAAAVADDDRGARRGELDGDGPADPTRGTRDECRLPVQRAEPAHDERASRAFSRLARSLTENVRTPLSMRLTRPESTLPGPTSTKVVTPPCTSSLRGLGELDRRGELLDEQRAEPRGRLDLRGHRRHERRDRVVEAHQVDGGLEALAGVPDERAVERAGDLQLDGSSCAEALGLGAALLNCIVLTGDDDLAGAVVVRRPHAQDLPAQRLDGLVLEPENRGHRARALTGGLGHRQAALADEGDRLGRADGADRRERRELADRMADDDVRLEPGLADRRQDGEARGDERRLLHLRLDEILERRVEAELLEIEARCLASDPVDLHRGRHRLCDLTAHACLEGALAREAESDLSHPVSQPSLGSTTRRPMCRPIRSTPSPT